jgi:hypothetical protein
MRLFKKILKLFILNAAKASEIEILTYAMLHSTKQVNELKSPE